MRASCVLHDSHVEHHLAAFSAGHRCPFRYTLAFAFAPRYSHSTEPEVETVKRDDAIEAVRTNLVKNGFVDAETVPGSDGRPVLRASEDGEFLGVIALADAYVEDVKSADAIKRDLRNQQAAQLLRTNKPAKRGKYLVITMGKDGRALLVEKDA